MEIAEHLEELHAEGLKLADAASVAALDTAVPGCPDWVVRDLLAHIGEVHRWAAAIVAGALSKPRVDPPAVPGDAELLEWFRTGHAALLETLRAAPGDLECFTFLPAPSPLAFWARRQAMETAIHRADAEGAAGTMTPFADALALDGIDEMLSAFGGRKTPFEPATFRFEPAGSRPWLVTLGPDGLAASRSGGNADLIVSGGASDVFRWLWNRPAEVTMAGDQSVAARWREQLQVRWD